jgi:hypothetical protein
VRRLTNYTHATVFVNVNATRGNISVSKYTHDLYFSVKISHNAFGFFCRVGVGGSDYLPRHSWLSLKEFLC